MGFGDMSKKVGAKLKAKMNKWEQDGIEEEKRRKGCNFIEELGAELLSKNGKVKTADALAGKTVALYFSAHWCPPCRGFTPELAEWYTRDLAAKGLEVVFLSADQDETAFQEYFKEQPWLALPFTESSKKDALSKKLGVNGIPCLVIFDESGALITKDGRAAVSKDPTGSKYPWNK